MNQVAQDRERLGFSLLQCHRNGIAHAEAHPQMFGSKDSHGASCREFGSSAVIPGQP
jgi:hypothetical protein